MQHSSTADQWQVCRAGKSNISLVLDLDARTCADFANAPGWLQGRNLVGA
jgi:hypothetical protein